MKQWGNLVFSLNEAQFLEAIEVGHFFQTDAASLSGYFNVIASLELRHC